MVVWIKEFGNIFTIEYLKKYFLESIILKPLQELSRVSEEDIIVYSRRDIPIVSPYHRCITLEDYLEKINKNIISAVQDNFTYYYISNAFKEASRAKTLFTGSSYGLFGLMPELFDGEVNLSLISQDLYYSIKGIYKVFEQNKNINNVVLICSYYYFYTDLSMTENQTEIQRVSKVYKKIFDDQHNCLLLPGSSNVLYHSNVFNVEKILWEYVDELYKKHYYTEEKPRSRFATKLWKNKEQLWSELTAEERKEACIERATSHNKLLKYEYSFEVNKSLFTEFVDFCFKEGIRLTIINPPVMTEYCYALSPKFKKDFYDLIDLVDNKVNHIDMTLDGSYLMSDFNDMDHLGDIGAKKFTQYILQQVVC